MALRFTSGVGGVPELASAEAFVEFEKEVTYTEDQVVEDDEEPKREESDKGEETGKDAAEKAAEEGTDTAANTSGGEKCFQIKLKFKT